MNRRGFLSLFGAAAALPLAVMAKQAEAAVTKQVSIDQDGYLQAEGEDLGIKITKPEPLYINSSGNLGWGTTTPRAKLEIIC